MKQNRKQKEKEPEQKKREKGSYWADPRRTSPTATEPTRNPLPPFFFSFLFLPS
jgi:hypothetical protein